MKKVSYTQYTDVHVWLRNTFGSAKSCTSKLCNGKSKKYHWALVAGKTYEKNRENFAQLCTVCHRQYDIENNLMGMVEDNGTRNIRVWAGTLRKLKIASARKGVSLIAYIEELAK